MNDDDYEPQCEICNEEVVSGEETVRDATPEDPFRRWWHSTCLRTQRCIEIRGLAEQARKDHEHPYYPNLLDELLDVIDELQNEVVEAQMDLSDHTQGRSS